MRRSLHWLAALSGGFLLAVSAALGQGAAPPPWRPASANWGPAFPSVSIPNPPPASPYASHQRPRIVNPPSRAGFAAQPGPTNQPLPLPAGAVEIRQARVPSQEPIGIVTTMAQVVVSTQVEITPAFAPTTAWVPDTEPTDPPPTLESRESQRPTGMAPAPVGVPALAGLPAEDRLKPGLQPGAEAQGSVSLPPLEDPLKPGLQPRPAPVQIPSPTTRGQANDYPSLVGVLEAGLEPGSWAIRYANPAEGDPYGGRVDLVAPTPLVGYRAGQAVRVEGHIVKEPRRTIYQVESIQLLFQK